MKMHVQTLLSYHSKSFDTAVFDMCENQPGGAVEQRKGPAGDDDPLGPGHGADVLQIIVLKFVA